MASQAKEPVTYREPLFKKLSNISVVMLSYRLKAGGVRHDPQRFMGKTVHVPHFNRDTIECIS